MVTHLPLHVVTGVMIAASVAPLPRASAEAPPDANPATRPATRAFDSVPDLQRHYRRRLDDARREIEAERFDSLEILLERVQGDDRRRTLFLLIQSAVYLDRFERAASLTQQFLDDYPGETGVWIVRQLRCGALLELGRLEDARKEWELWSEHPDRNAWQQVFEIGVLVADGFLDAGRTDDVKAIHETLRQRLDFVPNLERALGPMTDALYWIGRPAPALEGDDLAGRPVDLDADYRGKVVLLDFWATRCAPCIAALPERVETYQEFHDRGFDVIGISLDENVDTVRQFVEIHDLPWRQLCDGQETRGPNARKYDVMRPPHPVLIGRDGKIARVGVPARGFEPLLRRLLAAPAEASP